jgi:hypothetical protein
LESKIFPNSEQGIAHSSSGPLKRDYLCPRRVVPRPIFGTGNCLLLIEFKFAADFGRGLGASSVPAKAKQEAQMLGFSDRRVIGSPQQTQIRDRVGYLGFIASSSNNYISKISVYASHAARCRSKRTLLSVTYYLE